MKYMSVFCQFTFVSVRVYRIISTTHKPDGNSLVCAIGTINSNIVEHVAFSMIFADWLHRTMMTYSKTDYID